MKNFIHPLLFCTALLLPGLSSCVTENGADNEPDCIPTASVKVSFTLAMDHTASASVGMWSRSTAPDVDETYPSWSDPYNTSEAISFENRILRDGFQVAFYNSLTGAYIGYVLDLECVDFNSNPGKDLYEFEGILRLSDNMSLVELRALKPKMMIIANVPSLNVLPFICNLSDSDPTLAKVEFVSTVAEEYNAIPMWGVSSPDFSTFEANTTNDLGSIDLLRAMAKIEVSLADALISPENVLVSATLTKSNQTGFVSPNNWNKISATTDLKFDETLRVPSGVSEAAKTVASEDGTGIIFYVPEYKNIDETIISVSYSVNGASYEGTIYFRPYKDDGTPDMTAQSWDIVRNHHYKYQITRLPASNSDLSVKYTLCPMGHYTTDIPGFE